jgi:hypothetical protein
VHPQRTAKGGNAHEVLHGVGYFVGQDPELIDHHHQPGQRLCRNRAPVVLDRIHGALDEQDLPPAQLGAQRDEGAGDRFPGEVGEQADRMGKPRQTLKS